MCTGRPPFRAGSPLAVLRRVCDETPRPVREVNPDVPEWLAEIVAKLHEKDPARRFQSAAEVADLLGQHLAHLQHPTAAPAPARLPPTEPGVPDGLKVAVALVVIQMGFAVATAAGAVAKEMGNSRVALVGSFVLGVGMVGVALTTGLLILLASGAFTKRARRAAAAAGPAGHGGRRVVAAMVWLVVVFAVTGAMGKIWGADTVPALVGFVAILVIGIGVALVVGWVLSSDSRARAKRARRAAAAGRLSAEQGEVAFPPRPAAPRRGGAWKWTALGVGCAVLLLCVPLLFMAAAVLKWVWVSGGSSEKAASVATGTQAPIGAPAWQGLQPPPRLATLWSKSSDIRAVLFSPDGQRLVAVSGADKDRPGGVEFWNAVSRAGGPTLREPHGVRCAAFSPDGALLATGELDNSVKLRDPSTGAVRHVLKGHDGPANAPGKAKPVAADTTGHDGPVNALVFTPDSKGLVTVSLDGTAKLWDLSKRQVRRTFRGHTDWVLCVALSRDGKVLATGSRDRTVRVWELNTGRLCWASGPPGGNRRGAPPEHRDAVEGVAFAPDGKSLASANWDGTVGLWDVTTGRGLAKLRGHSQRVYTVAFSPDGQVLASGGVGGEVKLWDVAGRWEMTSLHGDKPGDVWSVTFSRDGRTLAAGGWWDQVLLWSLPPAR
jgi:WD40 repeat protein